MNTNPHSNLIMPENQASRWFSAFAKYSRKIRTPFAILLGAFILQSTASAQPIRYVRFENLTVLPSPVKIGTAITVRAQLTYRWRSDPWTPVNKPVSVTLMMNNIVVDLDKTDSRGFVTFRVSPKTLQKMAEIRSPIHWAVNFEGNQTWSGTRLDGKQFYYR